MIATTTDRNVPSNVVISRLQPRSVGGILDQAFRLYRKHFLTFLAVTLVVYVPAHIATRLLRDYLTGFSSTSSSSTRSVSSILGVQLNYVETFLLYLSEAAIVGAILYAFGNRPISTKGILQGARQHVERVLGLVGVQLLIWSILLAIIVWSGTNGVSSLLALLLSVLIGIYGIVQIRWYVALPALVAEELSPIDALGRSWELVQGYWWRTVGLGLALSILSAAIVAVPEVLVTWLLDGPVQVDSASREAVRFGTDTILSGLFMPVQLAAYVLYYFDLRARKESFDLEAAIDSRYSREQQGTGSRRQYGNKPVKSTTPRPPEVGVYPGYEQSLEEANEEMKTQWRRQAKGKKQQRGHRK